MRKKNRKMLISVGVAALLIMSVLTTAIVGVSGESGAPAIDKEDSELTNEEPKKDFDTEDMPSLEKIRSSLGKLKIDIDKDKNNGNEKKLDVMSREKMNMVKGDTAKPTGSENELMTDPFTRDLHDVNPVHNMGYQGDNVKVSLMDTGFDMAHPDLAGRHAVFDYNASTMEPELEQFDGYPIAYDAVSMMDYVLYGDAEMANWYVNTSYETAAYESNGDIVADYDGDTYTMPDYVNDGEMVRFGDHPDDKLYATYMERPALLLTKNDAGKWGNISTDLNNNKSFADEKIAQIDGSDPTSELLTHDVDGDGITDISGGMGYFVGKTNATGSNMSLPYTQNENFRNTMNTMINLLSGVEPGYIGWVTGAYPSAFPNINETGVDAWDYVFGYDMDGDNKTDPGSAPYFNTPAPGSMVALMGDFNGFGAYGAHGTWTASAVAGQGVTGVPNTTYSPSPSGGGGLVQGLAPNASIIPMGDFFSWPSSTGGALSTTYSSAIFASEGYDGDVSTDGDQAQIASSSFGKGAGYEGFGGYDFYERFFDYVGTYHTQNTLFVNSAGNEGTGFGSLGSPSGGEAILSVGGANNQHYRTFEGDDGGPNPWQGEVAQVGSRGPAKRGTQGVDVLAGTEFGYGGDPVNQQSAKIGEFNGSTANTLWSGTSLAAPNAAGVAALIYQAYWNEMGMKPSAQMVKDIIKQGADDINNSPFNQGSGVVDAEASVEIIQEGLYSSTSEWRPGMNPETETFTEMNVNGMLPGDSYKESLTLSNWDSENTNYSMEATHLQEAASNEVTFENVGTGPYLMLNETGVYNLIYNETNDDYEIGKMQTALDAPNADLFKLGVHNANPDALSLIEYYDWTDANASGTYDGFEERNRISYAYSYLGGDYTDIYNPIDRLSDGMIIRMRDFGGASHEVNLNIQQFNEVSFDWISIDNSTGTIPAGGNIEYNLTANVPSDAAQGIYNGKVMIHNNGTGRVNVVPVTITVGEQVKTSPRGSFDIQFGKGDGNTTYKQDNMYRNDRLYGSWNGIAGTGDWRVFHFYLENTSNGPVALNVDTEATVEAHLLGPANSVYSDMYSGRYGKYTLKPKYTTDIFRGNIGLTTPILDPGTYAVVVHSKGIPGDQLYENFTVEMFTVGNLSPDPTLDNPVVTNETGSPGYASGNLTYTATPGFDADTVVNISAPVTKTDTREWTDTVGAGNQHWPGDQITSILVNEGTHKKLTVQGLHELQIEITAADASDLDLFLCKDADGDEKLTTNDTLMASHGISGSLEHITVDKPIDGIYWVSINPYDANQGDEFTAMISQTIIPDGAELKISHPSSFNRGNEVTFKVYYKLPRIAGTYNMMISVGRQDAARGFELKPQITFRKLELNVESLLNWTKSNTIEVSGQTTPGSTLTVNGEVVNVDFMSGNFSTNLTLANGSHEIAVVSKGYYGWQEEFTTTVNVDTTNPVLEDIDYEVSDGSATVNGTVIEENLDYLTIGDTQAVVENGEFTGNVPLTEGMNTFNITAVDKAGNMASEEITIVLYNLTVNIEGNGTVEINPAQDIYESGTQVNLTAEATEGGKFVKWKGDYEGEDKEINITMDENMVITAVFKEKEEDPLDQIRNIPGFTTILLILSTTVALEIYYKKEQ